MAGGRSTGTSRPSSSSSCSTNSPAGCPAAASGPRARREQLDDLRRVQQAPPARGDDALSALVERLEWARRRVVDLDHDLAGGRGEDAQQALLLAAVGRADAAGDLHHLDAEAGGGRSEPADHTAQVLRRELDRRPDMELDAVPLQAPARPPVRLERADALERADQHALELGQRGHRSVLVAERREVADLGDGEQALVLRVRAGHSVEEVEVLAGGQALERELREAGQAQAVGHHRVKAAQHDVLVQAVGPRPERERRDRRHAAVGAGRGDRHDDAAHGRREGDARQRGVQALGQRVAVGHRAVVLRVEVGDGDLVGADAGRPARERDRGLGELLEVHERGRQAPRRAFVLVAGGQERAVGREALERAHAVEAARGRLEQGVPQLRRRPGHGAGDLRCERLRAGDQRGDALLALGTVRIVGQRRQRALGAGVDALLRRVDHRRVVVREADLAGEVGDDGVAAGRREDEPVERVAQVVPELAGQLGRAVEPAVEDRQHDRHRALGAALGEEEPVAGVFERGRAIQARDAVVAQRTAQQIRVVLGHALGAGVERAQERVEVLPRAALEVVVVGLVRTAPGTAERAHVGEQRQQPVLGLERPVGRGDDRARLGVVHVVAEDQVLEAVEVSGRRGRIERDPLAAGGDGADVERLEAHERRPGADLHVRARQHLAHAAAERRGQRGLHLHALDDGDDVAGLDQVAGLDRDRHDHRGGEVAHEAAVVARDAVGDAVDLDQQVGPLDRGQRAMGVPTEAHAPLVRAHALRLDLDRHAVHGDPVQLRADLADDAAIGLAPVAEVDRPGGAGLGLGSPTAGERVEARLVSGDLELGQLDRGLEHGDVGVAHGDDLAAQLQAVEPCGVDLAGAHLRAVEQLEQEALVDGAAVDHDDGVRQRTPQARQRLVAVAAPGGHRGHQRVEVGRDDVALGDAGVDAQAGAGGEAQQRDATRRGREPERRVLGVQARLDRVAPGRRGLALEAAAGRDVQLELDQVQAGGGLGHRVLDRQAGVDLDEAQALRGRLVEELDRAGVVVAGAQHQPARSLEDLALLIGGERGARRLRDHLLVAALAGAVAQAGRPRAALAVGDHLHFDVAGGSHQALDQQRAVAEGLRGLGAGADERGLERLGLVDAAHAAAAGARGGLDHQREADALGVRGRLLGRCDRPAAPRRDRDAGLLGDALGGDLVTQRAHDPGVRADEDDAETLAELGELRALGDEAPADPDRLGARFGKRALEVGQVEVAVFECDGLVGLAHEHRLPLRGGMESDQANRLLPLGVELAHRVDHAHGGLAAVDDREPCERPSHEFLMASSVAPTPPRRTGWPGRMRLSGPVRRPVDDAMRLGLPGLSSVSAAPQTIAVSLARRRPADTAARCRRAGRLRWTTALQRRAAPKSPRGDGDRAPTPAGGAPSSGGSRGAGASPRCTAGRAAAAPVARARTAAGCARHAARAARSLPGG